MSVPSLIYIPRPSGGLIAMVANIKIIFPFQDVTRGEPETQGLYTEGTFIPILNDRFAFSKI